MALAPKDHLVVLVLRALLAGMVLGERLVELVQQQHPPVLAPQPHSVVLVLQPHSVVLVLLRHPVVQVLQRHSVVLVPQRRPVVQVLVIHRAVMAPSAILLNYAESEEAQNEEIEFDATIETDYNQTMGQRVTGLTVSPEKVDTVVLWENFKFEKAYYGLPEEVSSFPVLCLSLSPRYKDCNALNIIQFIIEPARPNEDTTEGE